MTGKVEMLICVVCGVLFERPEWRIKDNENKGVKSACCSIECRHKRAVVNTTLWHEQNQLTAEERFWKFVDKTPGLGPKGDCWEWRGLVNKTHGYGYMTAAKKKYRVHKFSYMLHAGTTEVKGALIVMHSCDNRICVNPEHLSLGTNAQNMKDASERGRMEHGSKRHCAKLDDDKVREIRAKYAAGGITQKALGAEYGVRQYVIWLIVHRERWKHVSDEAPAQII